MECIPRGRSYPQVCVALFNPNWSAHHLLTSAMYSPKALLRPAHIQLAPGLAVGFARVPHDAPVETGQAGDGFGQILDADLEAAAKVDRATLVIASGRQQDALGGVLHVEELARR